jgi:hypothetical protein
MKNDASDHHDHAVVLPCGALVDNGTSLSNGSAEMEENQPLVRHFLVVVVLIIIHNAEDDVGARRTTNNAATGR